MLDQQIFTAEMLLLQSYYGKRLDDNFLLKIYDILSEEINTGQFQYACKQVFRHEKFFPTPQQFIDYALGNADYRALVAWNNRKAYNLPEAANFALEAIKHVNLETANIEFVKKEFIAAHKAYESAPKTSKAIAGDRLARQDMWLSKIKEGSIAANEFADRLKQSDRTQWTEFREFYIQHAGT